MILWHDGNEKDDEFTTFPYLPFFLTAEEVEAMYQRTLKKFNETCEKIEKDQDDEAIRRLLYDVFGAHSYCIEVPRG